MASTLSPACGGHLCVGHSLQHTQACEAVGSGLDSNPVFSTLQLVTSGKVPDLSEPQFPHQENEGGCDNRIKSDVKMLNICVGQRAQQTSQINVFACMSHVCTSLAV